MNNKILFLFFVFSNLSFCTMEISLNLYSTDLHVDDLYSNILHTNSNITIKNNIVFGNNIEVPLLFAIKNLPITTTPQQYLIIENNKLSSINQAMKQSSNNNLVTNTLITEEISTANLINNMIINGDNIIIGNKENNTFIKGNDLLLEIENLKVDSFYDLVTTPNLIFNAEVNGNNYTTNTIDSFDSIFNKVNNIKNTIEFRESIILFGSTNINTGIIFNDKITLSGNIELFLNNNTNIQNPYYLILNQNKIIKKTNIPPIGIINNIVDFIQCSNSPQQLILQPENNKLIINTNKWLNNYLEFSNHGDDLQLQPNNIFFNNFEINTINDTNMFTNNNMNINNLILNELNNTSLIFNNSVVIDSINSQLPDTIFFENFDNYIQFESVKKANNLTYLLLAKQINTGDYYTKNYSLYKLDLNILKEEINNIAILEKEIDEIKITIEANRKEQDIIQNQIKITQKENINLIANIAILLKTIKNILKENYINTVKKNKTKHEILNLLQEIQ